VEVEMDHADSASSTSVTENKTDENTSSKNDKDDNSKTTTIFVRNLPFDVRDDQLEKEFSEIGPIKRAFVVKDQDKKSRNRGFGYVQFVLQADAEKSLQSEKKIANRTLNLSFAAKKPKHLKRKGLLLPNLGKKEEDGKGETPVSGAETNKASVQSSKKTTIAEKQKFNPPKKSNDTEIKVEETEPSKGASRTDSKSDIQRTIVLTGLKEKVKRKAFRILCEGFGEIDKIVYPVPEREEVTAFVRYKEYKSAIRATQKIPGKKVRKSNILSAVLLTKENNTPTKKTLQQSRLIIRNLSFKCEIDELRTEFSKFGKVVDVVIPTKKVKEKETKLGCAFVQFANSINAKAALAEMNLKEIKGRQVVVDWAVSKEKYAAKKQAEQDTKEAEKTNKTDVEEEVKVEKKKKKSKKVEAKEEIEAKEEAEGDQPQKKKKKKNKKKKEAEIAEDEEMDVEDILEDSKLEDNEDENEDEEDEEEDEGDFEGDEDEDDCSDIDLNDEEDDEDEESEDELEKIKNEKPKPQQKDAKEGRTVFVRNLSFNVDEGVLEEEFEKHGEIEFCKLVMDHESGRSKGSAFIKFKEKKFADNCIAEFIKKQDEGVNHVIDGRPIMVSLAVTRGKLGEIVAEKNDTKKESDKRNIYLAAEGLITRNSPAADGLSDADLKKREKTLAETKAKLKNPNFFVSRTRLCVRNLPLNTDADGMRIAMMKQVPTKMNIKEIKIMRSKERRDLDGAQRSLGYGFIELHSHEEALALLRNTNNNPDVFGDNRRPIVGFSIENAKALKILELKKQRLEAKVSSMAGHGDGEGGEKRREEGGKSMKQKILESRTKRYDRYKRKRQAIQVEKKKNMEDEQVTNIGKERKQRDQGDHASPVKRSKHAEEGVLEKNYENNAMSNNNRSDNKSSFKRKLPANEERRVGKKGGEKEEAKFTNMVEQYKQKLFGGSGVKTKKKENEERWFE